MRVLWTAWILALLGAAPPSPASYDKPNPQGLALINSAKAGKPLFARIVTSKGEIDVALGTSAAPQSTAAFVGYATGGLAWENGAQLTNKPLYDDTIFHRAIPNFAIQGGDPSGKGGGGPGQTTPDESQLPAQLALHFTRGVLGFAHVPDANANGSQFFILVADAPWLDGKFTQLGHVISGQAVVDAIANAPRGPGDKPLEPVSVKSIEISEKQPRVHK